MKIVLGMEKLIWAGFATAAMASASVPALSWTLLPDVAEGWLTNAAAAPRDGGAPVRTDVCYADPARR